VQVETIPTLIDQFRETFEGEVRPGWCWVTDGPPESAVFGTIERLTAAQAFAAPAPGARSVAAHAAHLRFALDLTLKRLEGANPPADWKSSFDLEDTTAAGWELLKDRLRDSYAAVAAFLEQRKSQPVTDWPPINLVGLAAMTAHNAYHLGAIRQIARVVESAA